MYHGSGLCDANDLTINHIPIASHRAERRKRVLVSIDAEGKKRKERIASSARVTIIEDSGKENRGMFRYIFRTDISNLSFIYIFPCEKTACASVLFCKITREIDVRENAAASARER